MQEDQIKTFAEWEAEEKQPKQTTKITKEQYLQLRKSIKFKVAHTGDAVLRTVGNNTINLLKNAGQNQAGGKKGKSIKEMADDFGKNALKAASGFQ